MNATTGKAAPRGAERIVCIGDSITDGHTLILTVEQALREAGQVPPTLINAGIGGDTAAGMRKRLQRDVLVHRPTLVTLSVGINDILRSVPLDAYEADAATIMGQMDANRIPMIILTTTVFSDKHAAADKRLDDYNAVLRRLAEKHGFRVAEVNALMQKARADGVNVLEADDVHLNFEGYRVMARALLDALGYTNVAVARDLKPPVMPGIIRQWKVAPLKAPLDVATAAAVAPDATWKDLLLPQTEPLPHWWGNQERRRGFAQGLDKVAGPGGKYVAWATLEARAPRKVFLNPGASLEKIWLNGRCVYAHGAEYTGWHAGRERVPAELLAGRNTIVLETGNEFFFSVTDNDTW